MGCAKGAATPMGGVGEDGLGRCVGVQGLAPALAGGAPRWNRSSDNGRRVPGRTSRREMVYSGGVDRVLSRIGPPDPRDVVINLILGFAALFVVLLMAMMFRRSLL